MVGGVAEAAKLGTSVLGKEGNMRSVRGHRAQNLAGEPLTSSPLPGAPLWEEGDRCQAGRTAVETNQTSGLCTPKMFGVDWIITVMHCLFPPAFLLFSSTFAFLCLFLPLAALTPLTVQDSLSLLPSPFF